MPPMFNIILAVHFGVTSFYVGTFQSNDACIRYVEATFPTVEYSCLHRSFINLPEDLKEINMIEHKQIWSKWESQ